MRYQTGSCNASGSSSSILTWLQIICRIVLANECVDNNIIPVPITDHHVYFYSYQTGPAYDQITNMKENFTSNTRKLKQVTAGSWVFGEHQDPKSRVRSDMTIPLTIRTVRT